MRKVLYVFLVLICNITANCQTNLPEFNQPQYESVFGDSTTSWNQYYEIPDAATTDSVIITGDTIINGKPYKKVARQAFFSGYEKYFLRESDDHSQVYYYSEENDAEMLVLDLNLELSDTFYTGLNKTFPALVDSVFYQDDKKHIRFDTIFDIYFLPEKFEFIEGTGTNFGLLYPEEPGFLQYRNYLLCAWHDGNQVYSNKQFYGDCHVVWTSIEESDRKSGIELYPNPADGELRIDMGANYLPELMVCSLLNTDGRLIYSWITSDRSFTIHTGDLSDGLYIIWIQNGNKVSTGKFLVSH